ncbi:MAG TPA: hypothetical protein DCS93_37895 [Microscillaceae bacterium]|nr:hypothetical protein [Microscillaceae bacterium]
MIKEYLTFGDLEGLNSSPASIRSKIASLFSNVTPDGIALNKETYFHAVHPPITEQYNHYCYKTLGTPSFTAGADQGDQNKILATKILDNRGDTAITTTVSFEETITETIGWETSISTGLTFSTSFDVKIFSIGIEANINVTVGKSGSKTKERKISESVNITIPPKSRVKVTLEGTSGTKVLHMKVPIRVSGHFGANFPHPVAATGGDSSDTHYFWFPSASSVLAKTSGEITGTIKDASVFQTHTVVHTPEPISAAALA